MAAPHTSLQTEQQPFRFKLNPVSFSCSSSGDEQEKWKVFNKTDSLQLRNDGQFVDEGFFFVFNVLTGQLDFFTGQRGNMSLETCRPFPLTLQNQTCLSFQ